MKVRKLSLENPKLRGNVMVVDVVLDEGEDERHHYFASIGKKDYALGKAEGDLTDDEILRNVYFLGLLTGLGVYDGSEMLLDNPEQFANDTKIMVSEFAFSDKDGLDLPNSIEPFSEDRYSVSSTEETNDGNKYTNVVYAPKKNVIEHRIVFPDSVPKPYTPWC